MLRILEVKVDTLRVSVKTSLVFMVMLLTLCTVRVQGADSITVNVAGKIATATISLAEPSPVFDATFSQKGGNVLITGRVSAKLALVKVNVTYKIIDNTNWELITPKGGSEILSINIGEALNGIKPSSWRLKAIKDTTYTGGGSNKPLNEKMGTEIHGAIPVGVAITVNPLSIRVDRESDGIDKIHNLTLAPYPKGLVVDVNNLLLGGSRVPLNNDSTINLNERNTGEYLPGQRVERLVIDLPAEPAAKVELKIRNPDNPLPGGVFPDDFPIGNGTPNDFPKGDRKSDYGRMRLFTDEPQSPKVAIEKDATNYTFTKQDFERLKNNHRFTFWIEGTEPGEVIIDLEFTPKGAATPTVKRVRFEVNVDNPPKDAINIKNKKEARNRVHAIKSYDRVTGVSAAFSQSIELRCHG